ncbi:uncharacterized protein [Dermacentor andersoni]|uniref:uncharacterized protein n=1 Tax=Dermacentor andersoni TaxID=34620 RepID=UPI0024159D07|nr:uncharacterized protein LOC129385334 [Dermacentor andersoni]
MLCTMGRGAVLPIMYPNEYPCNYLFYSDVIIVKDKIHGAEVQTSWITFQQRAVNYTRILPGISFDYRYLTESKLKSADAHLNELQKSGNIRSYGILNHLTKPNETKKLYSLKAALKELSKRTSHDPERIVALAFGSIDYSGPNYMNVFKKEFQKVVNEFDVDIVIAITSVSRMEDSDSCLAAPPGVYISPNRRFPDLASHWELISTKMSYKYNAIVGLSFELGTMLYVLKANVTKIEDAIYAPCTHWGMASKSAVCGLLQKALWVELNMYIYGSFSSNVTKSDIAFGEHIGSCGDRWRITRGERKALGEIIRPRLAMLLYNLHLDDFQRFCTYPPFSVASRATSQLEYQE